MRIWVTKVVPITEEEKFDFTIDKELTTSRKIITE